MKSLLEAKQLLRNFINKYEAYVKPIYKLIIALTAFLMINGQLGYMHKIDNVSIALIAALMCSFMPMNFIVLVSAVFILLHMYALSLECAIIVLVLFMVLFLLYFRFSPNDTIVVVLTPICTALGIPYVMPVAMGLLGGPYSAVSVGCGVIVSFVLSSIQDSAAALETMATEDMATRFRFIIDGILDNKVMVLFIVAFAVTIVLVYVIKRLPINYSWPIAIVSGAVLDAIIILVGDLAIDAEISIGGLVLGTILCVAVGFVIQFFAFNVDYNRAEKLQFEDDEYYYYVKAVPKITVSVPTKTVKKINSSKKRPPQRPRSNAQIDE